MVSVLFSEKQLQITEISMSLRKLHGQKQCLIEMFQFCEQEQLVRLQPLFKRFYKVFAHVLIAPACIFRLRGISLKRNSPNIRLLEFSAAEGCIWRDFPVTEQGQSKIQRRNYFKKKRQNRLTNSKIVQANSYHAYVIGGNE